MHKTNIINKAVSLIKGRGINRRSVVKSNFSRLHLTLGIGLGFLIVCGVVAYAATSTILGVGTMPHSEIIDGPATLTARRLTIPPGEVGTWHYHPGIILSVVGTSTNTGSVTIEDGCGGSETFAPGQAFEQIGGRVHRASNLTNETVEEHNMFINPQGTPLTVNIPNNERLCGPAKAVDECLNGGWENFNFPDTFPNQGACISFVLKRPRTSLLVP